VNSRGKTYDVGIKKGKMVGEDKKKIKVKGQDPGRVAPWGEGGELNREMWSGSEKKPEK